MQGRAVRQLLRAATSATLATLDAQTGHPYGSLVEIATTPDAQPLLLISRLARHTRNLDRDPRASLLIDQRGRAAAPMTAERATIIGRVSRSDDEDDRRRYLARHPAAAPYADFADFGFQRLSVGGAHLIAGFGRIGEIAGQEVVLDAALVAKLADQEAEVCETVNAIAAREGVDARIVGLDVEGLDFSHHGQIMRHSLEIDPNLLIQRDKMCRLIIDAMAGAARRSQ